MKNLNTDVINNIYTGEGVKTDALAWLTAAEIQLDQATKQKLNIGSTGSSEFYKRKASQFVKATKRCLNEMWLTLSKYSIEQRWMSMHCLHEF